MKILVISPHPDDETLGAGGMLLKHKMKGNKLYWLNITDVENAQGWNEKFVEHRKEQVKDVLAYYQFEGFENLKYAPSTLENVEKGRLIHEIGNFIKKVEPEILILPDYNDAHSDHRVVFESAMACSKVFRYPYIKKIITMEIMSETDFGKPNNPFVPNYFVDISDYINQKIEVTQIYDTELGEAPFPRSVEAIKSLATIRGVAAGCRYAEAFRIVKWIE